MLDNSQKQVALKLARNLGNFSPSTKEPVARPCILGPMPWLQQAACGRSQSLETRRRERAVDVKYKRFLTQLPEHDTRSI